MSSYRGVDGSIKLHFIVDFLALRVEGARLGRSIIAYAALAWITWSTSYETVGDT